MLCPFSIPYHSAFRVGSGVRRLLCRRYLSASSRPSVSSAVPSLSITASQTSRGPSHTYTTGSISEPRLMDIRRTGLKHHQETRIPTPILLPVLFHIGFWQVYKKLTLHYNNYRETCSHVRNCCNVCSTCRQHVSRQVCRLALDRHV